MTKRNECGMMSGMEVMGILFRDLVVKNRSYRGFDESYQFTRQQMCDFIDLTRYTASSVNAQPLKYYVAWEKAEVEKILAMTKWARALPDIKLPHDGMHPTGFVIICQDTNIGPNLDRYLKDVGIVAQTILLSAVEQGLGGCMIGNFVPSQVKEEMHFPENIEPLLIVALGKPAEDIVITDVGEDGKFNYYRDDNDVHYVPKRALNDILINKL